MMTPTYWIFVAGLGLVASLNPVPHQMSEESLRSALNAVTRKQRSLNANSQAYFGDLPSFKYREANGDRKLQRQQVGSEEIDDNEESLAFIPSEGAGQLETIGDGYQHLNNKQFGRALMDYFQYTTDKETPTQSIFRERERTDSHKRTGSLEHGRLSDKKLARILQDNIENSADDPEQFDDDEYQRNLEMIYNKYRNQGDNIYGDDPLFLSEILGEEDRDENQDPRFSHLRSEERRNVNARYPLFTREYRTNKGISKRFPVAKRSAKAMNMKRQVTDPKVAKDLGTLFGTQSTETVNHTHDHVHGHDHAHDHAHEYEHEHNHNHVKGEPEHVHDHTSETPNSATKSKNLKESLAKVNKTKESTIEVKKKSVDWSQYFGIDRRKKKAVYMGRPATQDQDDEYLLQKYYEIMAENLNPSKDSGEKQEKLQQMDWKLKNMKDLMIEEAVQVGSENDIDNQEVKDEILSRLAAAYSLQKLRRVLNELGSSTDQRDSQKAAQAHNNLPANQASGSSSNKNDEKRNRHTIDELQGIDDEMNCPEIDIIERHCKTRGIQILDFRQALHVPCVTYHICNTCGQDECLERFVLEAEKICQEENLDNLWSRNHCIKEALLLPRYPPAISATALCNTDEGDLCLARYQNRYRHRYFDNNPYATLSRHLANSRR